ncbi:hypothetical protein KC19_VG142200 [Ceratodon purpureus]|uniref:Uncharacterized protein n=1 Tax=Ceratodon purpureus TaxID=3225 RepID=A0A8T0HQA4_CERPU|nr:hypothetical protein KC19_VG142200 [Ceratodon purpureus]
MSWSGTPGRILLYIASILYCINMFYSCIKFSHHCLQSFHLKFGIRNFLYEVRVVINRQVSPNGGDLFFSLINSTSDLKNCDVAVHQHFDVLLARPLVFSRVQCFYEVLAAKVY